MVQIVINCIKNCKKIIASEIFVAVQENIERI